MATRMRANAAETITAAIIERLRAGVRPWRQPWTGGSVSRPLRACGTPYRGINTIWLWSVATARDFRSSTWMTYRQAEALGGQVRRGERGTVSVFYTACRAPGADEQVDEHERGVRCVLKSYTVFNADQIDALPARFSAPTAGLPPADERDWTLDAFFAAIPATIIEGEGAWYQPVNDIITMPNVLRFTDRDHYRATLAHELSHWTGHGDRLGRTLSSRFGSEAYAVEELVAELASAMLGADLGLPVTHLDDHASYIDSWLKVLGSDPRAILMAASKAEEAANFLLGYRAMPDQAMLRAA